MPVPAAAVRRWASVVALASVLALGCGIAGLWQWQRHSERSQAVEVVLTNQAAAAVPLDQALAPGTTPTSDQAWQRIAFDGEYLPDVGVLLRNRPVGGQPGFHVLEGLRVVDGPLAGTVLVVDRGWVPTGGDGSGATSVPSPPAGVISVVAQLRSPEPESTRSAPAGQVQAIAPEQVRTAAGTPWDENATLDAYAMVVTEDGVEPADLGMLPRPATDLGPHLSYAFQWWVFAVGALGGAVVLVLRDVRDLRDLHADDLDDLDPQDTEQQDPDQQDLEQQAGPRSEPAPDRRRGAGARPGRRRPTAEEEEDAELDAQDIARRAASGTA